MALRWALECNGLLTTLVASWPPLLRNMEGPTSATLYAAGVAGSQTRINTGSSPLASSRWTHGRANCARTASKSSCKSSPSKFSSLCSLVPATSSPVRNYASSCGRRAHSWTSIIALMPQLRDCETRWANRQKPQCLLKPWPAAAIGLWPRSTCESMLAWSSGPMPPHPHGRS
jgi:hypothetical protein